MEDGYFNGFSFLGIVGFVVPTSRERRERYCEPLWMSMVLVAEDTTTLKSNQLIVRCIIGILRVRMRLVCFTAVYLCLLIYDLVPGILLTGSPSFCCEWVPSWQVPALS